MFTGLIAERGEVAAVEPGGDGARLRVRSTLGAELSDGDSIAVNGVCLTALDPDASGFAADLSQETLARSTLGSLEAGSLVNLELAMRLDGRLGGHIVQGHVDGVATVAGVQGGDPGRVVSFSADPGLLRYVVDKGPVAIDGISLTVAGADSTGFSVSLIPETLERTNLTQVQVGDRVNLEVDLFAKYVEKLGRHDV